MPTYDPGNVRSIFYHLLLIVIIYDGHCFNCSKEIIALVAKATQHIGYKSSQQKGFAKLQGWVGGVGWESKGAQLWSLKIAMFKLSLHFFHWGAWSHLESGACQLLTHPWCILFSTQPVHSFTNPQCSARSFLGFQFPGSQLLFCLLLLSPGMFLPFTARAPKDGEGGRSSTHRYLHGLSLWVVHIALFKQTIVFPILLKPCSLVPNLRRYRQTPMTF